MSLVPRFPKYQLEDQNEEIDGWFQATIKYPSLKYIVQNSRGRFARYFIDKVKEIWFNDIHLWDLIDEACGHVSIKTHQGKGFLNSPEGVLGQKMAITYNNVKPTKSTTPPPTKRFKYALPRKNGASCMHKHFANLVDEEVSDITLAENGLEKNDITWEPRCCFPSIEEDILLYLAILGGRKRATYYSHGSNTTYSAKKILDEFRLHGNTNAESNDVDLYENTVAHAVFSSSRRNGVQGLAFDNFFSYLLGEFQDIIWQSVNLKLNQTPVVLSDLIPSLANKTIPFLAPINALWPSYIFDQNKNDCNFGNFCRATNRDRVDLYIKDPRKSQEHRHDMKSKEKRKFHPIFLADCKCWRNKIGMSDVKSIVEGVDAVWTYKVQDKDNDTVTVVPQWNVLFVFCLSLNGGRQHEDINQFECLKIDREGQVEVIIENQGQQKHVVIVETDVHSYTPIHHA
ncbi:Crinkler (CRN) family protein [Thraustotheca clavata]|uniref:Crinkler (CRN) family protein n=1 Tax=Thraustotheca clavata TaxID=74557 RepID=A0A1V9YFU5_9STRA|nr:Crinkler (CRN) family protein [Thraustotheca clavata]